MVKKECYNGMTFKDIICKMLGHDVVVNNPLFLSKDGNVTPPTAIKECRRCGAFIEYVPAIPEGEDGRIVGVISVKEYEKEMKEALRGK